MNKYILSLGSNLGDRLDAIAKSVIFLIRKGELIALSSVYETEPIGVEDQSDFLNCAVYYRTYLMPEQMLSYIKYIETNLGRNHEEKMKPRQIDIDIINWSGGEYLRTNLTIPHKEAEKRYFVVKPVNEIVPDTFKIKASVKKQKLKLFCGPESLRFTNI